MHNKCLLFTPLGLLIITVLVGVFLSSTSTSATSASTALASVKVAASCTLTTSGGGNYSATVPNGTSAEIAGSTLTVSCNDAGGFALYAVGFSDSTVGNNSMIGASTNISTNTSGSNSYWAMKVNPVSGNTPTIENSFNNYHIIPDTHTKVASYNQSTSGSLAVTSTYKVNISSSQLAGNYLGKVKYTLVHPANEIPQQEIACDPGKICYNPNTNIVEGQMGQQSASNNASVTLWASNFSRTGYGFAGWSDSYDYENDPDANLYGPQETITAPSDISTNGLSLYAIWVPSQGSMQSNATSVCNSLDQSGPNVDKTLYSVSALTDERDNQTYAIAKLADGNCWMIENLRLDNTGAHNTDGSLSQGYDSSFIGLANPEFAYFSNSTTANSLYSTDGSTNATISGSNTGYRFPRYNNNNTNSRQSDSSHYSADGNTYSYGNYYTWHAAIADTTRYTSGDHGTTSICPTGWRIPIGNQSTADKSFGKLSVSLGGPADGAEADSSSTPTGPETAKFFRNYPNNFVCSGYYSGSAAPSAAFMGSSGYYWTSTASGNIYSYHLYFGNPGVRPGTSGSDKFFGYAIRCTLGS